MPRHCHARGYCSCSYHNLDGTALSYLVHTAEKRCIPAFYDYCVSVKIAVSSLIHDGLHADIDLRQAEMYVFKETGFGM